MSDIYKIELIHLALQNLDEDDDVRSELLADLAELTTNIDPEDWL